MKNGRGHLEPSPVYLSRILIMYFVSHDFMV